VQTEADRHDLAALYRKLADAAAPTPQAASEWFRSLIRVSPDPSDQLAARTQLTELSLLHPDLGSDLALSADEIGALDVGPRVRIRSAAMLSALRQTDDAKGAIATALGPDGLTDLTEHGDEVARARAAWALARFESDPQHRLNLYLASSNLEHPEGTFGTAARGAA